MATIRQFFRTIGRFFYWGWKLRNNYDFDYQYLEDIIYLKLKRMENQFKNGPTEWGWDLRNSPPKMRLGRVFKQCVELSRRLVEEDYSKHSDAILEQKYGQYIYLDKPEKGLWFRREKLTTEDIKQKYYKDARRLNKSDEKREQSDREELHRLLGKYGRHFWD